MKTRVDLAPVTRRARPAVTNTVICTHVTLTRSTTRGTAAASRAVTSTRRKMMLVGKIGNVLAAVALAVTVLLLLSLASGVPITELFNVR
jgi:hypothetical protein